MIRTNVRTHVTFTRMVAEKDQTRIEIDLAVDSPPLFPIETIDGLPVLAPQDLAARKVLAILDRAEGRDYTDLCALVKRFSRKACVDWALQLDAGLTTTAIADAFGGLDRLADAELPSPEPDVVRGLFTAWSIELRGT